jgi:hypothetical protein
MPKHRAPKPLAAPGGKHAALNNGPAVSAAGVYFPDSASDVPIRSWRPGSPASPAVANE